ncbi:MAG: NUDIX domain-containing protein [Planctomycetota bacterium]
MHISASGIVVYKMIASEPFFLLLKNAVHGTWGFPKGHLNPGEDRLSGAFRECNEETGLAISSCDPGFQKRTEHKSVSRETGDEILKRTWYFLSPVDGKAVSISPEHTIGVWEDRLAARDRLQFDNLRELLDCAYSAATSSMGAEHPDLISAYALLDELSNPDDLWRKHCRKVAEVSCLVADHLLKACPELPVDRNTLEASALLHDIGRSHDHSIEHPRKGMELLMQRGLGHLSKPCISHWIKGRKREELAREAYFTPARLDSLFSRFDLETLTIKEKIISVVDSLVHQDQLVPLQVRYKSARERYGDSQWMRDNERITEIHIQDLEGILKTPLYTLLQL